MRKEDPITFKTSFIYSEIFEFDGLQKGAFDVTQMVKINFFAWCHLHPLCTENDNEYVKTNSTFVNT